MTRLFSARISPFMRSRNWRNSASAADSAATGSASPDGSGGGTSAAWPVWRLWTSISELPGTKGQERVLEGVALVGLRGSGEQPLVGRDGEQQRVRVVLGPGEAGVVVGHVGEREVVVGEAGGHLLPARGALPRVGRRERPEVPGAAVGGIGGDGATRQLADDVGAAAAQR